MGKVLSIFKRFSFWFLAATLFWLTYAVVDFAAGKMAWTVIDLLMAALMFWGHRLALKQEGRVERGTTF